MEPIDHQGQPCHGATVNPRDAQVVYVCLDPTRHGFPTLDELDAQAEAERAVALAESDRRSRMLAAYEASMERLPKAKIPKGAIIDFVLLAVTRLMDDYMADVVEMLGIKRAADAPSYMSLEEADHLLHVALEDHPVERVALAVCMAWTTATSDETSHGDEVSYALEQLLRTYGGLAAELEAITAESNQEGNAPATLALDEPTDAEMVAQAVETGATVDLLPEGATVEMADTAEALEVIDAAMTPLGPGRRRGGVDAGQAPGDAEAAALPTRCAGSGAALLASGKAGRRADCPVCGQSVSVTLAGAARSHG